MVATPTMQAREAALMDGNAALNRLMSGNQAYTQAEVSASRKIAKRRAKVAEGQRPFAVVVACSDSRVSPEIVFDQSLGDLFVVRLAGNVVDDYALGSIEYAVEHLGARLVVVMGHARCGAVDAALQGVEAEGHVREIIRAIAPAVKEAKHQPGDPLVNATRNNAARVARGIARSKPSLASYAGGEPVSVVAAYYHLDSGKIELIDPKGR